MGTRVLTLADVWPNQPRAMIVGLNPSPTSVEAGHYYQGQAGRRQLRRLVEIGLFAAPTGNWFEEVALAAGIGFTDVVKRPTVGEGTVTGAEIEHGSAVLRRKLEERAVPLIICVFRHPMKALIGSIPPAGLSERRTPWGAQVYRMPGPYASTARAANALSTLRALIA